MPVFEVRDGLSRRELTGTQLAAVSTERDSQPRWTEIELYYGESPPAGQDDSWYWLQTIGRSVVYHVHDSGCNTGVPTAWADLPVDGEPCPKCGPPPLPPEGDPRGEGPACDLESDHYQLYECRTADDVLNQLQRGGRRLSFPAQLLLERAALNDRGIAEAIAR